MCNLYSHVKGPKAIRDLAKAMGGEWTDNAGNLEPQPSIFPEANQDAMGLPVAADREKSAHDQRPQDYEQLLEALAQARTSLPSPGVSVEAVIASINSPKGLQSPPSSIVVTTSFSS